MTARKFRYASICSGIEAVTVAWHGLNVDGYGFEPAFFAEVEPFCCELLRQRFPAVPNLCDITKEDFDERAAALGPIDILVGGSPCQGFSTAGKRGGLDDERSALALSFVRIAKALQPKVVLWENVPGVFTTNGGRDFGAFLGALVDAGFHRLAWRVCDSQWWGVPQRRRRVFLVSHSGDQSVPDAVLFEPEGEGRDSQKGRKTRKKPARTPGPGPEGGLSGSATLGSGDDVVPCLRAGNNYNNSDPGMEAASLVVQPFNVNATYSCAKERHALETETARCLDSSGGFAAQQGGTVVVESVAFTDRGREGGQQTETSEALVFCLTCPGAGGRTDDRQVAYKQIEQVIPIDMRQASRGEKMTNNRKEGSSGGAPGTGIGEEGDSCPALANSHTPAVVYEAVCVHGDAVGRTGEANTPSADAEGRVRLRPPGLGVSDDGTSFTLNATSPHAVAYQQESVEVVVPAYGISSDALDRSGEGANQTAGERAGLGIVEDAQPTLRARPNNAVAYQCHGTNVGPMGTLRAGNGNECGGVPFVVEQEPVPSAFTNTGAGWWNEAEATTSLAHREYKSATVLVDNQDRGGLETETEAESEAESEADEPQAFYTSAGGHNTSLGEQSPPLKVCEGGGHGAAIGTVIQDGVRYIVRRLTPREAERLQGFPDDYTLFEYPQGRARLTPAVLREVVLYLNSTTGRAWTEEEVKRLGADSHRYRALGNAMTVPVMAWLGERILRVLAMLERGEEIPTEMA